MSVHPEQPVALAVPVLDIQRVADTQKQILDAVIRILERSRQSSSLYVQELKGIRDYEFVHFREIGVLLFFYHNMLEGKDRPPENKECMSDAMWAQLQTNRDFLIKIFFHLLHEEEERKQSWWHRLWKCFQTPRTVILPETHYL
jgi:hypothetical protein